MVDFEIEEQETSVPDCFNCGEEVTEAQMNYCRACGIDICVWCAVVCDCYSWLCDYCSLDHCEEPVELSESAAYLGPILWQNKGL